MKDFGFAQSMRESQVSRSLRGFSLNFFNLIVFKLFLIYFKLGSPLYMAPESNLLKL